jgi:predicted MFS family arabinose efflux permease
MASFLCFISLNSYLTKLKDYSYLPNTLMRSSGTVLNGLFGILPIFAGVAALCSTIIGSHFRYQDTFKSMFTLFYGMFGDTMFDAYVGASQCHLIFTVFLGYLWTLFAVNVVKNITLAQVSRAFVD